MPTLTSIKLSLAAAGIILFGIGIKTGDDRLRWFGIAFVAVAWLLRFLKRPSV